MPEPVIVRLSDFKSNEYANLIGGPRYEPHEENPMLGFRGAGRYIDPTFQPCFDLECQAIRRVREDMGLTNVLVMVPFVRTLQEAEAVTKLLAARGLARGQHGLKVIMMCEIPSNALLADRFLEFFDDMSIGSNDLTQLTLGLDRDSAIVSKTFDERDPAVDAFLAPLEAEPGAPSAHVSGFDTGRWSRDPAHSARIDATNFALANDDGAGHTSSPFCRRSTGPR